MYFLFLISSHCSSTLSLCQVPGPINSSVNEAMQGLAALMGELNCSRVSIGAAMTGGGSLLSNIGMWRNTKHGVAICLMMSYVFSNGYLCDIVYVYIYMIMYYNVCIYIHVQHVLGKYFLCFLIFSSYLFFFWFTGGQAAPWSFVWTVQSTMQHCSQGSQQPSECLLTENAGRGKSTDPLMEHIKHEQNILVGPIIYFNHV